MSIRFFYNFCLRDDGSLEGDILSAVRRSYFKSSSAIHDRIIVNSDKDYVSYEYSIEKNKPMHWTVKSGSVLLQDSKPADNGKYSISFYKDNSMYKRLTFSKLHTLLRCAYYDSVTGEESASLEPRKAQSGLCILYAQGDSKPLVLYPMPEVFDERIKDKVSAEFEDYSVIASTDIGTIKFLSEAQIELFKAFAEDMSKNYTDDAEECFVGDDTPLFDKINAKDFNVKKNLATSLDITQAADFSYELPTDESDSDTESEYESVPADNADIPEETDSEDSVCKPDKIIEADGAVYRYYGELDENGSRSGYGRTLTDNGHTAYEGYYRNDKRSGSGSYYYKDGSLCYTGDWTENVRHGIGVGVSSQDGSIHAGKWSLNKPEGNGVRLTSDGDIRFVCKELSSGGTVLMNFMPDDTVLISKYDENGKKLGEDLLSLKDFIE